VEGDMSLISALSYLEKVTNDEIFFENRRNTRDYEEKMKFIRLSGYDFNDRDLDIAFDLMLENLESQRFKN
jgi:hypothetical protein